MVHLRLQLTKLPQSILLHLRHCCMICSSRDAQCLVCFVYFYVRFIYVSYFPFVCSFVVSVVIFKYRMAPVWCTGNCLFRFLLFVSYYFISLMIINYIFFLVFGRKKVCESYMLVANFTGKLVKKQRRDMMTVWS